jgi:NAD(P)-dependent dehydrogenase (short-subunit alcohol dehydrogenase family)
LSSNSCIFHLVSASSAPKGSSFNRIDGSLECAGDRYALFHAASKSGLSALRKSLAEQLRTDNIQVGITHPGVIDTPQLQVDADDL